MRDPVTQELPASGAMLGGLTIITAATFTGNWVGSFPSPAALYLILKVSGKVMDAGTTADIYLQTFLPDGSAHDVLHCTQITSAAIGDGTFYSKITPALTTNQVALTAPADATTAAATVGTDSLMLSHYRAKIVTVAFAGTDTLTLQAWLHALRAGE